MRREHFFATNQINCGESLSVTPPHLYPQETDWTCAIACIRTILSAVLKSVPSEDEFVETYKLVPGPHYSIDIKNTGMLDAYDVKYGCEDKEASMDDILELMKQGYCVMLESMMNYAHWMVLLGFYTRCDKDIEKAKLLFYDPYYNEVKLVNADEFINMWIDGNHAVNHVEKDYIAIKKK